MDGVNSLLFLYGPPGAGKTAAGRLLASRLDLPFIDLDARIEQAGGRSVAALMGEGEASFRALEGQVLSEVCRGGAAVVALGGGALLRPSSRARAEACGLVVVLSAEPQVLLARLAGDAVERPLLKGDPERRLASLLSQRRAHYQSFPLQVDAGGTVVETAWAVERLVGRHRLQAMGQPYDVVVLPGGLERIGAALRQRDLGGPVLVVSDSHVTPLYAAGVLAALTRAGYETGLQVIPAGERFKNLETAARLWRACLQAGLDRGSTVLALGGGVVGDLSGFAAATFMRGCSWAAVPTSLLAMVDAAVGGKTGIDLPVGKNLVGAFHPPRLVLADPRVLASLPPRQLRAGLAEVVKHGVAADPELFRLCARGRDAVGALLPELVRRAAAVKVQIVEADPYEQGVRAMLNLGHTIGHALELVSGFSLLHGEAVAIGMVVEARLAERLGLAQAGLSEELQQVLSGLGLPTRLPEGFSRRAVAAAVRVDKKRSHGRVRFALPVRVGEVRTGIEIDNLEEIL